jgi:two-component system, cell cycle sensor histidine kinase and response regulator CckA
MVVDDDPALLKFTSKYLTRLGYSVTPCRTSEEALRNFEASPYAVVLIDFSMPRIRGDQLSRMMLQASSRVRLVLSSGIPVNTQNLLQAAPGRVAFLHKPFTPAMLAETVKRLLESPPAADAD